MKAQEKTDDCSMNTPTSRRKKKGRAGAGRGKQRETGGRKREGGKREEEIDAAIKKQINVHAKRQAT